jgi:hypothetical protein
MDDDHVLLTRQMDDAASIRRQIPGLGRPPLGIEVELVVHDDAPHRRNVG